MDVQCFQCDQCNSSDMSSYALLAREVLSEGTNRLMQTGGDLMQSGLFQKCCECELGLVWVRKRCIEDKRQFLIGKDCSQSILLKQPKCLEELLAVQYTHKK